MQVLMINQICCSLHGSSLRQHSLLGVTVLRDRHCEEEAFGRRGREDRCRVVEESSTAPDLRRWWLVRSARHSPCLFASCHEGLARCEEWWVVPGLSIVAVPRCLARMGPWGHWNGHSYEPSRTWTKTCVNCYTCQYQAHVLISTHSRLCYLQASITKRHCTVPWWWQAWVLGACRGPQQSHSQIIWSAWFARVWSCWSLCVIWYK